MSKAMGEDTQEVSQSRSATSPRLRKKESWWTKDNKTNATDAGTKKNSNWETASERMYLNASLKLTKFLRGAEFYQPNGRLVIRETTVLKLLWLSF